MILLVIILWHSTKSTFTYHFTFTDFLIYQTLSFYYNENTVLIRSIFTCITNYYFSAIPILIYQHPVVRSCLFYIWNHMGIGLSYKVLWLRKAHKIEWAKDGTCMEDVTSLYKYCALKTSITRLRYMVY